jgi:hypothetical protein
MTLRDDGDDWSAAAVAGARDLAVAGAGVAAAGQRGPDGHPDIVERADRPVGEGQPDRRDPFRVNTSSSRPKRSRPRGDHPVSHGHPVRADAADEVGLFAYHAM